MIDCEQIRPMLESTESAGGVAVETIRAAEEKLGVRFPPSYRFFLAEYGNIHGARYEIAGLSHETVNDDKPPYWWDVVTCNMQMRRSASGSIPSKYVLISDDGGDYKFFLDTSRPDLHGECPVIVLGPGVDAVVVAINFCAFLRRSFDGNISF